MRIRATALLFVNPNGTRMDTATNWYTPTYPGVEGMALERPRPERNTSDCGRVKTDETRLAPITIAYPSISQIKIVRARNDAILLPFCRVRIP